MDALTGSWQYENISSANGISLSPPSSPTLYFEGNLMQSLDLEKELLTFEDADPFIGTTGGAQLLSSANGASPVVLRPSTLYDYKPIGAEEFEQTEMFAPETESQGYDIDIDSIVTGDHAMTANVEDVSIELNNLHRLLEPTNAPSDPALELATEFPNSVSETADISIEDMRVGTVEFLQVTQEELQELIGQSSNIQSPTTSYAYDDDNSNSNGSEASSFHEFEDFGHLDTEMDVDMELAYEALSAFSGPASQNSSLNSSDAEDEAQDEAMNALLRNDFAAAQGLVSSFGTRNSGRRKSLPDADPEYKPTRRGRKPTTSVPTSWKNVKDKSQRKKQQNRAAASKYRQKKKEEFMVIEQQEAVLAKEYEALLEKKALLLHESSLIKKLLREKLAVRK